MKEDRDTSRVVQWIYVSIEDVFIHDMTRVFCDCEDGLHSTEVGLAFTRYCHYQCCVACIAIKDGRGVTLICAIVWAMKGAGGCPNKGR